MSRAPQTDGGAGAECDGEGEGSEAWGRRAWRGERKRAGLKRREVEAQKRLRLRQ